jgi:histidine phosphotransferase ChpT
MQGERDDLAATQLLMSHLCHELVSPIGAVSNGIEMLEDFGDGDELAPEALALIRESGKAAAAKLRFYRLAYGRAGQAADLGLAQCAAAIAELLATDARVSLDWQAAGDLRLIPGAPQLVLNLAVLGAGALPRGGRVAVAVAIGERAGRAAIMLGATGVGAKLSDGVQAAARGQDRPLDHTTIHAWYCQRLASRLGTQIALVSAPDEVRLEVVVDRLID